MDQFDISNSAKTSKDFSISSSYERISKWKLLKSLDIFYIVFEQAFKLCIEM